RDIVARAIHQELAASGEACAYLDLSAMKPEFIRERFPTVVGRCAEHGVDVTREPIPIVPAAHFSCGGVHTDLAGRTNVRHLNAVGETGCTGLHGANRLASTSLLECLLSAKFPARADAVEIGGSSPPPPPSAGPATGSREAFHLPTPRPWVGPTHDADPTLVRQDLQ